MGNRPRRGFPLAFECVERTEEMRARGFGPIEQATSRALNASASGLLISCGSEAGCLQRRAQAESGRTNANGALVPRGTQLEHFENLRVLPAEDSKRVTERAGFLQ